MRNPERIPEILAHLERIWSQWPDLRLGQLIVNAANTEDQVYFLEDDQLVERLLDMERVADYVEQKTDNSRNK